MAHLTIRGEAGGYVIGIGGGIELCLVARKASRAQAHKNPAGMAVRAREPGVRAGEREQSPGVVKSCAEPCGSAVTQGAIRGESRRNVVGIGGSNERLVMAAVATSRSACKSSARVTLSAAKSHVGPGELELRHGVVIEGALQP